MKRLHLFTAMVLLVGMVVPAWTTGQAASGGAPGGAIAPQAMSRQALAPQAAAAPGDLGSVSGASTDWWATVQQQIQQDQFTLSEVEAEDGAPSFAAHNPVHAFDLAFSGDGVHLVPARNRAVGDEAAWNWGLRLTAYGYEGRVQPLAAPPEMAADGTQLAYRHAGLTEWYVNDERGLEQGFVLEAPPPAGEAGQPLVLEMALDTGLVPALSDDAQSIDFLRETGTVAVLRYTDLVVVDAAGNELAAHLSVSPGRISIEIDDAGAAYPLLVDPVVITPDWTAESDEEEAWMGTSVATAGDVNGDGYDDVIVGVPGYDAYVIDRYRDAGRAYLYYGSAAGLYWSGWFAEGGYRALGLGTSVGTAGDVNADGYDDVVIGAPADNDGTVYVYFGSASGLGSTPDWSKTASTYSNNRFGASVGTAGDVNGDGYDDLAIGSPGWNYGRGQVSVYHGSATGLPDVPHWTANSDNVNYEFGTSVGTAGDVNGDGYDDLVFTSVDTAYVYLGSATGLADPAVWSVEGDAAGTAGDVNGDGYDDLVVGASVLHEGGAFVYYGSPVGLPTAASWSAAGFGDTVGTAGDMNGDGYDDVVVGAPSFENGQSNEGGVFVYYGSPIGLPGDPHWTAESDQASAGFGSAAATAGDVNGDGYDDVLVGAPWFDNGQVDEGRAYLFLGPVPVTTDHQWLAGGEAASDEFGRSVATAGDVNGDGYSDVVVGAPYNGENGPEAGKVYVFLGGASGLVQVPWWTPASEAAAWTALGEAGEDWFGSVVGTAGDLNGDGYDDLIVGAPGHGGGKVYVYYGSATGLGAAGWTANGQYARDEFGSAAGTAGDVNGDGYDDLVVGASGYPDGVAYGKVYLYHGAAGGLGTTPAWSASGPSAGDRFGRAVSIAGDVNSDGYSDVAIGAPMADPSGFADAGQAYVYYGGAGGLSRSAYWSVNGIAAGDSLGAAVGMAGDVNGDGYSDVVIGAPLADPSGFADAGQAYVYLGAVSGLPGTASWSVPGATPGSRLGAAVFTAGDANGDGYADVVIGVYGSDSLAGQIQLYQGSSAGLSSTPGWTTSGEAAADRLGLSVSAAGDVNGDGFGDFVAGAPGYDGPSGANAGQATVYQGSADGPSQDYGWLAYGITAETAGDVNGDGYSDVVLYDRRTSPTLINRVYVYYGSKTGLLAPPWEWRSATDFRCTVGTAGDVNGDGYADVLVSDATTVRLFHGSATGLIPAEWPYTMPPDWSAAICGGTGCAVGTAGDVNGDGFGDLVVGSKNANTAWVYYGSPTGLGSVADWTKTATGGYGSTVGTAGDVNGDGYADLIVTGDSTVYAYYGSVAGLGSGTPDLSFTVAGNSSTPCTAATAGDVNGDGYADVVVGAAYTDSSVGKAYLFHGSAWGLDAPLVEIMGQAVGDEFGSSVATAGDVNGDGYADVLVGAPGFEWNNVGKAYLYYGSSLGLRVDQEPWTYTGVGLRYLGSQVAGAGDVNGDGYADVLITSDVDATYPAGILLQRGNNDGGRLALARQLKGDGSGILVQPWGRSTRDSFAVTLRAVNPLGRGRARIQVQACPPGTPFGDVSCQDHTADEWTEIADAAGVELTEMVEWLQEDTLYRWRARLLYDLPFYPQGPWHRFLGQGQEADVRVGQPATDLRITMTMAPAEELLPPAPITYTLSYMAAGGPATGVVITDILPASLDNVEIITSGVPISDTGVEPGYVWWVGDLEAGEGGIITITAQANATRFVNTAIIAGTSRDVNPTNNVATVQTHVPGIIYVDADARGADDGSSWVDAYTDLQVALGEADGGDQIWVAEGVYKPTTGLDRTATYAMVDGVAIYGGFAGDEAFLHERDWRAQPTVLSGDIGTVGNDADNIYHVVTALWPVNRTAVLDGFIITGGRATGEDAAGRGGGIYIDSASPTLRSLALLGNTADEGGGLYTTGDSPLLANVVLSGNAATTGGGLYNAGNGMELINVTFSENAATLGGALYDTGEASLANCIVWDEDPTQSLLGGDGETTVTYSDVRGGCPGGATCDQVIDADPQFWNAKGADGAAGTLDDDLRLHTTFRYPSPVIDQGDNSALPADADDLDGDGDVGEPLPFDVTSRARLIGFTELPATVDMGALEANIEDVLAEGDALLAEGKSFRLDHLQLLSADTLEMALLNYSNFNDGEWYYAFCSDYDNLDADGYCPETGPDHVRNDLLDTVDVYRVAVSVWPTATWTTRAGEVIDVWHTGGQGVLGATVEIGNDHLIFGNEYLVDATDYRFSTAGLPYADQIIGQELEELAQAARQFELVMDLIFRAFGEWQVGDYCNSDQFETFGVTSSLLMSALDEMASRYYMMGQSALARNVYLEASQKQSMHLTALAKLAEETGQAYLVNGSWEMLNNVSRMRERARQIEAGFDFFGFRPDYAPLQSYAQLLELTEGPGGGTGLLGTARDLEDQARDAQRTYDTNATEMSTELDEYRFDIDEKLFELCGPTEDVDGDGYGDYRTCEGGLMAKNWAEFQEANVRRALAWNHAQNIAFKIQQEQERADQTIEVIWATGERIAAADLAIGKLEAEKTTTTSATATEAEWHAGAEVKVEAWVEYGGKASTIIENNEVYSAAGVKASVEATFGANYKDSQVDTTQTEWDPNAVEIGEWNSIKDLKQAEAQAAIEGANSAATIKNLLLEQSEALLEWEVATAALNQVVVEHNNMVETWSRLVNLYAEAVPTVMTYNSHLLNPAYRLWRDSLTIQSSAAHALAAQFAYLTARASEYELLTPFPNLGDAFKTRTANDIRSFLDDLKVWHQALDLPGQLNRYPYTLSVARDFFSLTDEQLDPEGVLAPEQLAQERYNRLQEAFASRTLDGDLEIVFTTSLEQQRPGGHYFFSPNLWNNRIAGIGDPLSSNVGVKVNIITTEPVDAGVVEVVLVHDGQATYRNAAGQEVVYDPATAVPVGYLVPAELSPAYTTVVIRPDINGQGGLPNSGLVNLSVAASHWKLRIPADSWGNLDVCQIEDIEILLDTTGRALPGRTSEAEDDAERLAVGLEMEPPSQEWLQELYAMQQEPFELDLGRMTENELRISAPSIPGVVSGSYSGNLVVTSPITIAVQELNFDLVNVDGSLTGVVGATDSPLSSEPISLTGTVSGDQFTLTSDLFTNVVNGRVVTQTFTLVGYAEEDADILRATYTGIITNLLPTPVTVESHFIATRPAAAAGNGLLVEAGTWRLPLDASTPITVTLLDDLLQPIAGTGTVTFTTELGEVVPSTVEMVDGVAIATLDSGGEPGETVVVATMGDLKGRVRIQIEANDGRIADAGPDQVVGPGVTVTLDGSGSSDLNGRPLWYHWVQTGGEAVTFSPALSVTTFIAPATAGQLLFDLTVDGPCCVPVTDQVVVTVNSPTGIGPTAVAGPDQRVIPGTTVTLDGSGSSDPNDFKLFYRWVQVGGLKVDFSPTLSVTTFIAPDGLFTFTLSIMNSVGMTASDSTIVTATSNRFYLPLILKGGPQAQSAPDQGDTSLFAGGDMVLADIKDHEDGLRRATRPWWWAIWQATTALISG